MSTHTPTWQERGNCWDTDPTLFFMSEPGGWPKEVFLVCATCPVTEACLEFALANFTNGKDRGVWGGTTARERRRLRAARRAA